MYPRACTPASRRKPGKNGAAKPAAGVRTYPVRVCGPHGCGARVPPPMTTAPLLRVHAEVRREGTYLAYYLRHGRGSLYLGWSSLVQVFE
ncbi:hypothetical protein EON67_08350 [archaeon]|nr:MAG: hypothetical protein EON67_08350 [archaeon]